MKWFEINRNSLAFSTTSIASSIMHSVFMFYYVKVFLNRYHINETWFQISQIIYMLWNAVNDPLFGYFQDHANLACLKSRRQAILYGGPIWVIAFLLPWFPWQDYQPESWLCGLHLIIALCFYDAMFTFVLLAQACLFAEMPTNYTKRVYLHQCASIGSLIGSSSVFICEWTSSSLSDFRAFQVTCVMLGCIAFFCMVYTGKNAQTQYDIQDSIQINSTENSTKDSSLSSRHTTHSIWTLTCQILRQRNFMVFVLINLGQEFHRTFCANFRAIIMDAIVPASVISQETRQTLYGSLVFVPAVINVLSGPLVAMYGAYQIYKISFYVKIMSSIVMYCLGPTWFHVLIIYLLLDSVFVSSVTSLMGIPLCDTIEEDRVVHKRKHPMSSMVFGTNALITKPGQSLAPMLTVWVLNMHGYDSQGPKVTDLEPNSEQQQLHQAMFTLVCFVPLIIGTLQAPLWSFYSLRRTHETIHLDTDL